MASSRRRDSVLSISKLKASATSEVHVSTTEYPERDEPPGDKLVSESDYKSLFYFTRECERDYSNRVRNFYAITNDVRKCTLFNAEFVRRVRDYRDCFPENFHLNFDGTQGPISRTDILRLVDLDGNEKIAWCPPKDEVRPDKAFESVWDPEFLEYTYLRDCKCGMGIRFRNYAYLVSPLLASTYEEKN